MRECGTFLYQVVANEPEAAMLRKDSGLIVYRTILEVKDYVVRDPIAVGYLNAVSRGKGLAFQGTQCKKAVEQTLGVANGHFFCG
jgi:hypothetical protein